MAELRLHGRLVPSVFNLLGQKENDVTYSLGWGLARSAGLLKGLLERVLPNLTISDPSDLVIRLQEHSSHGGYTDIEILGNDLHVIIEAKRGWELPSLAQLEKYVPRFATTKATRRVIVTMSECSPTFAAHYSTTKVLDVPVCHLGWKDVAVLARAPLGSHAEKRLLAELRNYLSTIVTMQTLTSNIVYVVSLNNDEFAPELRFLQIVNERKRYFHPYGGNGWPVEPPNYIGYRYDGRLQSIHHVEGWEVIRNFHPHFPECQNVEVDPHILYTLGPAIIPTHQVKTGKLFPSQRVRAMLDLLLTCSTVSEARDQTKARLDKGKT